MVRIFLQNINLILLICVSVIIAVSLSPGARRAIAPLRLERYLASRMQPASEKYRRIILLLLFAAAVFVRVFKFGSVPNGVNQDEAMAGIEAYAIANHATDRFGMFMPVHFTAWEYGQMSSLLTYLVVPFVKLFGLNPVSIRIPLLLVSLLALIVLYKLVRGIWGESAALITFAFAAFNPWHIMQSRWSIDCNLFPHVCLFGVYFLWLARNKKRYAFISMIFFGLCMYCYGISFYTVPLFLLLAAIYLLCKKMLSFKDVLLCAAVYFAVAWPIYAMMIINFFKLPSIETPFFTIPLFPDSVRTDDILFFSEHPLAQLRRAVKDSIKTVLLQEEVWPWNSLPKFGVLYLFSMPLTIYGFIFTLCKLFSKKVKDSNLKYGAFLTLAFFSMGIAVGVITRGLNVNRINIIWYSMIIFTALGIYQVCRNVKIFTILLATIYAASAIGFSTAYFKQCYPFFAGFRESLQQIEEYDYQKVYVTSHLHENYWDAQVSEILTLFHHSIDAEYLQGKAVLTDEDGKPLPAYKDRYAYVDLSEYPIDPNENAVYILNELEIDRFDEDDFAVFDYGDYCAAIPKRLM